MEDTNQSLTKAEYDALVAGEDPKDTEDSTAGSETLPKSSEPGTDGAASLHSKEKIAEVGKATKKRKAIKVVGGDENDDRQAKKPNTKDAKKTKKKAKPVKLTFGDEEDG